MPNDVNRSADSEGHFLGRHTTEVVHLDDLGGPRVFAFKGLERSVEIQYVELLGPAVVPDLHVRIPWHARLAAATFAGASHSRVVDQHLAHHARHEREKVRAVSDVGRGIVEQLDERLIDQRCRLQRMSGALAAHERLRNPPQLVVDERHQLVERGSFARPQAVQ
jgi:hypothetical protein